MRDPPVEEHECTVVIQFVHLVEIRNLSDVDYKTLGFGGGYRIKMDIHPSREPQNFEPSQILHKVSRP